jgi:hypothetical protein
MKTNSSKWLHVEWQCRRKTQWLTNLIRKVENHANMIIIWVKSRWSHDSKRNSVVIHLITGYILRGASLHNFNVAQTPYSAYTNLDGLAYTHLDWTVHHHPGDLPVTEPSLCTTCSQLCHTVVMLLSQ